jgi:hypothetical protein
MSYRFLPYVRRGLADRINDVDQPETDLPSRAQLPVRVSLSTGDTAKVDLRLYGPGDVIGIDPRVIVRTEPPRLARNVEPDQFVAIEFDSPDFPWMFTPARAGTDDKLRPWLVLVVVAKQDGVAVVVRRDRPLPQLVIEPPAVPADELPNLSESWAWAHAHVVEDAPPSSVADHLERHPHLNVSRLLCPRRLESGRDYIAAVVPALEHGLVAGLGQTPPDENTTKPAWGAGDGSVGVKVTLPMYFHWEFRTGPAGDFESLARQLVPRPVPDTVGRRRMFIGDAHPALPSLPAETGGILELEGALRAPEAGSGPELGPEHAQLVAALTALLDAPADHVIDGASDDAEAVAPPIYGGRHVQEARVVGSAFRWLTELNGDPRHRAAAGLGAEIVRLNQERYMQSAWEQVGDVVAANALLDRARFVQQLADRIHQRHLRTLPDDVVLSLSAAVHRRIPVTNGRALTRTVSLSTISDGAFDPSFRRIMSPRSAALTRAARLASHPGATVTVEVINKLADGQLALDVLAEPPDGLVSSRLFAHFGASPTGQVGPEIGAVGTAPAAVVKQLKSLVKEIAATPVSPKVALRSDLAKTGILLPRQLDTIESAVAGVALEGSAGSLGATTTVAGLASSVLSATVANPKVLGFVLSPGRSGVNSRVLELHPLEPTVTSRPITGRGRVETVARVTGAHGRVAPIESLRDVVAAAPAGAFEPRRPGIPEIVIEPGGGRPAVPIDPKAPAEPTVPLPPSIDPPIKTPAVLKAFVNAFDAHRAALSVTATSIIPAEQPLDLVAAKAIVLAAIDPHDVIEARAGLAVRIGDSVLRDGLVPGLRQRRPLDPVMAGPLLPEPLYGALAAADPDRFLPGVGDIPDDTITLLETNPRFVEAFLIGANHEMNRELLWRRYPTDRRGTPFRRFWDRGDGSDDIGPIDQFPTNVNLGTSSGGDLRDSLVLLVRGQLLRRYPDAVVYASPAKPDKSFDDSPAVVQNPIFWGRIPPDVTFVGFGLTVEEVEPDPGWYFVIAEQPTEPRFGLDVPQGTSSPATWSDLDWGHVDAQPGDHLKITSSGLDGRTKKLATPIEGGASGGVNATFGRNSAHMAAITFQRPFRAVLHSGEVLAGNDGIGLGGIRPVLAKSVLLRPIALPGRG